MMSEVDEIANLLTGRFQVVDQLGAVFACKLGYRLDFDNDLAEAKKVRLECVPQRLTTASELKYRFVDKRDILIREFD
jgi:hypothetical protein